MGRRVKQFFLRPAECAIISNSSRLKMLRFIPISLYKDVIIYHAETIDRMFDILYLLYIIVCKGINSIFSGHGVLAVAEMALV
jgi:hypothetical protein